MADMLVKLYDLKSFEVREAALNEEGIKIRRAIPPEKHRVLNWIENNFYPEWRSEADVAFSKSPAGIFIAYQEKKILGFACYDTTAKGFFGPTGVGEDARGKGIGTVLLLKSLAALKELGYVYAVIGGAGPVDYYKNVCDAQVIKGSEESIYKEMLV